MLFMSGCNVTGYFAFSKKECFFVTAPFILVSEFCALKGLGHAILGDIV